MAKVKVDIDSIISKGSFKTQGLILSEEVRTFFITSNPTPCTVGAFNYSFDFGSIGFLQSLKIVGVRVDVFVRNLGTFRRVIGSKSVIQANGIPLGKVPRIVNNLVDSALSSSFNFTTAEGNNYVPCEIEIIGGSNNDIEFNVTGIDTLAGVANDEATADLTVFYREYK